MKKRITYLLVCGLFFSPLLFAQSLEQQTKKPSQKSVNTINAFAGKHMGFEKNKGQFDKSIQYRLTSSNANVDFFDSKVIFSMRKEQCDFDPRDANNPMEFDYAIWEIEFVGGANHIQALDIQKVSNVNYFTGSNKAIKKEVAKSIVYENIYEHIDLHFYLKESGELKYDFILHPGANLNDIKLRYKNVDDLSLDTEGNLLYHTKWGEVMEEKPFSFNEQNSVLDIAYSLDKDILSFSGIDSIVSERITIDPVYVDWSTYFYGSGNNGLTWSYTWVYDLDIDDNDNVYVAGLTNDVFPGITNSFDTSTNGFYDAFVCKMSAQGDSIVWFSYLGGSSYEYCFSLAVNDQHEPTVGGFTWSTDFPVTPNAYDTTANISGGTFNYYAGYVTKFSSNGDSLIYSTFLGGTGSELIQSMTMDDTGNVYVTGSTNSTDFPTTPGCFQSAYAGSSSGGWWWTGGDAFLSKLSPDGSTLKFSTYIGGSGDDVAYEVALSPNNDIYIVGKTGSGNFPKTPGSPVTFNQNIRGALDGFIVKMSPNGSNMVYGKMMGGDGDDWFEGVYVNELDEAYISGISRSTNFYTSTNAYQKNLAGGADAVIVKLTAYGQSAKYSTYLGGSGDELYYSGFIYNSNVRIAANVREEAIICGISRSNNFPVTSDALFATNPSTVGTSWWNSAATIAKLDYLGKNLLYGSYYGGSSYEVPGANKLKRISCYTNILYGGFTASSDYPTTPGVYKESKDSNATGFFWTGFISKFRDTLYTDVIDLNLQDTIIECDNVYEIFNAKNVGADILWSDGTTQQYKVIQDTGTYYVQATYGCDTVRDTIRLELEYSPIIPVLPTDTTYCDSFPLITLDAKNDTILSSYLWYNGDTTQTVDVDSANNYWVTISTPNCGSKTDSVKYKQRNKPNAVLPPDSTFCNDINIVLVAGDSTNDEVYLWNTGVSNDSLFVNDTGYYQIHINNICGTDSADFVASLLKTPSAILPDDSIFCNNVWLPLKFGQAGNNESYLVTDLDNQTSLGVSDSFDFNTAGSYLVSISNKCGSSADSLNLGLIHTPNIDLGKDSVFCDAVLTTLESGLPDNNEIYAWHDGLDTNYRIASDAGLYWLEAGNKCGTSRDSVVISIVTSPTAILPEDSVFCDVVSIVLDAEIVEPSVYRWQDGTDLPNLNAAAPGKYWVEVSNLCGNASDTMNIGLIATPVAALGSDKVFCGSVQAVDLTAGKIANEEAYLWSDGTNTASNTLFSEGDHWVIITNKCGSDSDAINIRVSPYPIVDLGADTTLCGDFNVVLDAGNPGMEYEWLPYGENTQTINANEQITYTVKVTNADGCVSQDEFTIDGSCVSHVYIPTAFSPNNDGRNDDFKPSLINYQDYEMRIFNRWGEQLFYSNDPNVGWDGTYKGKKVQNGVYLYQFQFITTEDLEWQNISGVLNLVR